MKKGKNAFRSAPFAKRSFGQNFLVDQNYIDKIIAAVHPSEGDLVVEIGPGRGALTERLLEKAGKVIAFELDRDLAPILRQKFEPEIQKFELVEGDALSVDFTQLPAKTKLVANLPYNISTAILQRLIEQRNAFSEMVLMFQKEVVDRITAPPGNGERGFLTVLVEAYLDAEKLFDVPPNAFKPVPKVDSSVVRLVPKTKVDIEDFGAFRRLVSAGFAQKRKTILNNLKAIWPDAGDRLISAGIDPQRRAETLGLEEWKKLCQACSSLKNTST